MAAIYDHHCEAYRRQWDLANVNRWNGAYYYSVEIVRNIIPAVKTERPWVTINAPGQCEDGAIVFIHNNLHPERYDWLKEYKDLVLVCGIGETVNRVKHLGTAIYLPLSIDVAEVEAHKKDKKDIKTAFIGRRAKRKGIQFPPGTVFLEAMDREHLLYHMARCESVYCVGRTAIEAKVLGCKVLPYDPRFLNPKRWKVLDNKDAAGILQEKLDRIDRR